jgi:hypothetical protein
MLLNIFIMKALLITIFLAFPILATAQEYSAALMAARMDLDSVWEHRNIPAADKVCLPAPSNLLRKGQNMSDHDLVVKAINTAKVEGEDAAIPWLLAAFCYDQPAQDRVAKAGKEAVRYIMNKWGDGEQKIAGRITPATSTPVELKVNFTNKTGDWVYFYSLMTDQADGKRECQDYIYAGQLAPNRSQLQVVSKGQYLWIRFADKKDKTACTFKKEYKVGPAPDQQAISGVEYIIE